MILPHAFSTMTVKDPSWNMDTSASSHLTFHTRTLCNTLNKRLYPSVRVGDGTNILVTNTGHSILPILKRPLHLHNVLVTPNIIKNLISVCQFTRDTKCTVEFDEFGFSVKDFLTRHILRRCDSSGDLYPVTKSSYTPSALLSISPTMWHQRLGHPGDEVLQSLVSHTYILCNKAKSSRICHACHLGCEDEVSIVCPVVLSGEAWGDVALFRTVGKGVVALGVLEMIKRPGRNTPQCYTKPLDSLKNWNNRFFWVDERVFPTVVDWRTNAPKDGMPAEGTYSIEVVRTLDTHRTPIKKQPEMLLCLVGISRRYYLGDELYPTFLHDDDRVDMDLFNLIRAPNPTKVKTGSRPRAPHEVPLLTLTATRVIEMDEPAAATDSSGVSSTIERELPWGKSLAAIQLGLASTVVVPEDAPAVVSDPDPLSFADAPSRHPVDVAQSSHGIAAAGDPESDNASSAAEVGSPESVYRPEWGVTNGSLLDTPEACQDLVDHVAPPGFFFELRHMHNEEFLRQYNVNLARQMAMGSQLRLRFEQEAKLLRKSVAQVARRDKRIQARELEIRNLEASLEAEANAKKAAEDRSVGLSQELENMCAQFLGLRVSNECLSQQVATLQQQVSGKEKLKAAFKEFKQQQDERVEQRCAEMEARLDALSIDFDEELYPHMLTAIAGRRWVIGRGLHLAVMKYGESLELRQAFADALSVGIAKGLSEGLRHELEHGQAQLSLESIEAYDPEAEAKFVAALQALKDLKYPLVDQLESLKDAPMDVIMASLYLESDTGDDAPQDIRDLRPSSSQLTIPVYPEVRDPRNPWAVKEEIVLADAIMANISRAEKKKKCRIVCRTYEVGYAHHARSDGVPVSVPTVVPQGLALLLADAATQTEFDT
nr:ribonuclease H-like domain-containing protein [Tanacetum cinerariifolium]